MSGSLLEWSLAWKHTPDPDYAVDVNVHASLARIAVSREINEECLADLARDSGHSIGEVTKSFKRLFWSKVLRRVRFDPPKPSIYVLTGNPVKRTPLGGKRFREPTPEWDGRWAQNRAKTTMRARAGEFEAAQPRKSTIWGHDLKGRQQIVAASDGEAPFHMESFVARMHPKVAAFCRSLSEGATIDEARLESDLAESDLAIVLPKLKAALAVEARS